MLTITFVVFCAVLLVVYVSLYMWMEKRNDERELAETKRHNEEIERIYREWQQACITKLKEATDD